jgi:hypothetical protein
MSGQRASSSLICGFIRTQRTKQANISALVGS